MERYIKLFESEPVAFEVINKEIYDIYKNPSTGDIAKLIKGERFKEVRGIIYNINTVYLFKVDFLHGYAVSTLRDKGIAKRFKNAMGIRVNFDKNKIYLPIDYEDEEGIAIYEKNKYFNNSMWADFDVVYDGGEL